MVSKCANPECSTPFQYFRSGKLFQVETDEIGVVHPAGPYLVTGKRSHRVEHFWLCGPCSAILTLTHDPERGIVTAPRYQRFARRAAAS
jgi:hypothetical protein